MTHEDHLINCGRQLAGAGGPPGVYQAVQDALAELVGHRLFTLLVVTPGRTEVERIWTSDVRAYPLQGRKRMGPTPWGAHVIEGQKSWMCNDAAGIRWAFPDHALIESLGLGACINVPVVLFGRTLGTLNMLDRAGAYDEGKMDVAHHFAPYLIAPYIGAAAEIASD